MTKTGILIKFMAKTGMRDELVEHFQNILPEPLSVVVDALKAQRTWDGMLRNLPDIPLELAESYRLASSLV
jgi:hypothetical protein